MKWKFVEILENCEWEKHPSYKCFTYKKRDWNEVVIKKVTENFHFQFFTKFWKFGMGDRKYNGEKFYCSNDSNNKHH